MYFFPLATLFLALSYVAIHNVTWTDIFIRYGYLLMTIWGVYLTLLSWGLVVVADTYAW